MPAQILALSSESSLVLGGFGRLHEGAVRVHGVQVRCRLCLVEVRLLALHVNVVHLFVLICTRIISNNFGVCKASFKLFKTVLIILGGLWGHSFVFNVLKSFLCLFFFHL